MAARALGITRRQFRAYSLWNAGKTQAEVGEAIGITHQSDVAALIARARARNEQARRRDPRVKPLPLPAKIRHRVQGSDALAAVA